MKQEKIIIKGGNPLIGEIQAAGAKNAITKLLVASLLTNKQCIFHRVPNIKDVDITLALCKEIGMQFSWDKKNKIIKAQTKAVKNSFISQKFSGANRIPILILGALIARAKNIKVPIVGGDNLGKRSVDFHIEALQKLGVDIQYLKKEKTYLASLKNPLKGIIISLKYPSVGATENIILASVKAKGKTVIHNAAMEPEVIDLILFLQKLGVNITFDANRTIYIQETKVFYDVEHTVLYDRNEVVSYALAAIASKGKIFIKGANHLYLVSFLNKLRKIGGEFKVKNSGIEFFYKKPLQGNIHIETDVYPGFMTDWQQPFGVLLTQCNGSSIIHETVYENRFGYTKILKEMGADIELFTQCLGGKSCRFANLNHPHSIIIKGPTPLKEKDIEIPDLRAGFAYVMAALISEGKSSISCVPYLDRGYENIIEKLSSLGANIKKIGKTDTLKSLLYNREKSII